MPDVFEVLRRDHEEVKQILAKLEKDRSDSSSGKHLAQRRKLVEQLIIEESRHEAAEEMHFWPAVRERVTGGDRLADHAISQEQEAKKVLAKLDKLAGNEPEFERLLATFIKAGREHIDYEQAQVWPKLRDALSKQQASDLGTKIKQAKKNAPTRPHPGTPPSPAALKAVGPVAAATDKARDAATGRGTAQHARSKVAAGAKARADGKASAQDKTRAELYAEARKLGVEGRSSMNKAELARHVSARQRRG